MTAQAVLASGNDPQEFARLLGWKLRWWLLGIPAGTGMATLRSCVKLWVGYPPTRSGVYSAGNGPVMRSAILGVLLGSEPEVLRSFVQAATVITHTDPQAIQGALMIALAAHVSSESKAQLTPEQFKKRADEWHQSGLLTDASVRLIHEVISHLNMPSRTFLENVLHLEGGVTGYINHTVSMTLHIWLTTQVNFRRAISTAVDCGGDTDTLAAAVGGIIGASTGRSGIPQDWISNLWEYPRSEKWIKQLATALSEDADGAHQQIPVNVPALIIRNIGFLLIVSGHGFRRMVPPY